MSIERTSLVLTDKEMALYRATAQKRWAEEQQNLTRRHERARALARQAAAFLKEHFGATKVVTFGSLVHEELFHFRSDVDLAAWGIDEKLYCRAIGQLLALDPDIEIDLVRVEEASPSLRELIEREGVTV